MGVKIQGRTCHFIGHGTGCDVVNSVLTWVPLTGFRILAAPCLD